MVLTTICCRSGSESEALLMDRADWLAMLSEPGYSWDSVGYGASERDLAELARWVGRPLPEDYTAFLRLSDGAEVSYDALWGLSIYTSTQLPELAVGYGVTRRMPGAILFGTDGGPFGLVFDARPHHPDGHYPVLAVDWVVLTWQDAISLAQDFRSLLTLRRSLLPEVPITRASKTNDYAFVAVELKCPYCRAKVSDWVLFQWGYCPRHTAFPVEVYHLGDPIAWKRCSDGSLQSWVYFAEGEYTGTIQVGDPAIKHLITRDVTQFSQDPDLHPRPCAVCGRTLEGAAVEIRDGHIQRAWIYELGDLDKSARDFLVEPEGTLTPVPEWVDHPLDRVRDG